MTLEGIAIIVAAACNLLLAGLIFFRSWRRLDNALFLFLALSVAAWSIGLAYFLTATTSDEARLLANTFYFSAWCIALAIWSFSRVWVGKPGGHLPWYVIGLAGAMLTALVLDPRLIITHVQLQPSLRVTLNVATQIVYSSLFIGFFSWGLLEIYLAQRLAEGFRRLQLEVLLTGILSAGFIGVIFNLVLPWFGDYGLVWIGPVSSVLFVASIAYAIARHHLFDIRALIVRSIAYVATLSVLAGLFAAVVFGILSRYAVHLHLSGWSQVYISVATALSALAFNRLKPMFDHLTNRLFYRDAYDAQELLDKLNRLFVTNTDLEQLLGHSARILEEALKADFCFFGIRESGETPQRVIGRGVRQLSAADIELVRATTPHIHHKLIVADELQPRHAAVRQVLQSNDIAILGRLTPTANTVNEGLGYLVLGPRRSGNPYAQNDLRVLEIILNELVIAIENSLRFEEINHFNETLQDNVSDATRKLRRTNAKLKQLDETKDEFITMASHQLRTPLTSVKGYLSMVLEGDAGKLNQQQTELLTQSFVSAQRMVYLIADLLNLSRLSTGKFIIEPSLVNLRDIVQSEIDQLRETAKSRGLRLQFDPPVSFPQLLLDETKIHQVVMNFIDNAIYYTPAGGSITVSLRETPTAVEYLVQDNGIGVPKAEQHKLFAKFYRAGNARQARPDGTGLGLFMAKKVIVAQGGAIMFNSAEGKGSTFGFRFSKAKLLAADTKPS